MLYHENIMKIVNFYRSFLFIKESFNCLYYSCLSQKNMDLEVPLSFFCKIWILRLLKGKFWGFLIVIQVKKSLESFEILVLSFCQYVFSSFFMVF